MNPAHDAGGSSQQISEDELPGTPLVNTSGQSAVIPPARAPESWRGAGGQDLHFASMDLLPLARSGRRLRGLRKGKPRWSQLPLAAGAPGPDLALRRERRWRDVLLFSLELIALVGFLAILGASYTYMQALNRGSREMQEALLAAASEPPTANPTMAATTAVPETTDPPTHAVQASTPIPATPTSFPTWTPAPPPRTEEPSPQATATETPSPTSTCTPSPTLTSSPTSTPSATPTLGPPRRLVIPKIGVDAVVVRGDTWEDLKKGVGHRVGSANPGEVGNVVLSAHNDVYGEIFRDLRKLIPGDEAIVHTDGRHYRYVVKRVETVRPNRVEFLAPTDYPALTMITCHPYLIDTHRVVVIAELAE